MGSLLIGAMLAIGPTVDTRWRLLLGTGFLGGFTTFSAWQAEALLAARNTEYGFALTILFGSLIAGFAAVLTGYFLTSRLR